MIKKWWNEHFINLMTFIAGGCAVAYFTTGRVEALNLVILYELGFSVILFILWSNCFVVSNQMKLEESKVLVERRELFKKSFGGLTDKSPSIRRRVENFLLRFIWILMLVVLFMRSHYFWGAIWFFLMLVLLAVRGWTVEIRPKYIAWFQKYDAAQAKKEAEAKKETKEEK